MEAKRAATITKQELSALPMVTYAGSIFLIDSEEKALEAAETLRREKILGFDTETKPSFKRGQTNNVALLQLSTHSSTFLIRLNHIGLPDPIKSVLEDEGILKIGVSIHDDFHNLNKLYDLSPAGFIDLQSFVKDFGIADNSLARIYAILFGMRISKGQRLTNWEADELTIHQQAYAALDALACVEIYEHLIEGKFNAVNSEYYRIIESPVAKSNNAEERSNEKN
ncbi:MAG: 3'-5' exonuclease domain-containing protein 2 [Muribaculaceae bacterium]|nr:3'-5' exonuclease domain-containing protein 2 [Muribaculaceae bacterium]